MRGGKLENLDGPLWALSSLDGRYHKQLESLKGILSEGALITSRMFVELSWVLHLASKIKSKELSIPWEFSKKDMDIISDLLAEDLSSYAPRVKSMEKETNHDVKAVEYVLKNILNERGVSQNTLAMIHFACTSEDINNTAYSLLHKKTNQDHLVPSLKEIVIKLSELALQYKNCAMVSRTHGQTATPSTMGKELLLFAHRMDSALAYLEDTKFFGKFNGAVGNYNAHVSVDPRADWEEISRSFVEEKLQLTWNPITTQIENHDFIVRWCQNLQNFASIGIDLAHDMWGYISIGYFKQKFVNNEVGSSTMPHKINPIDFENAEGNFGVAINLGEYFSRKLPISRWQRDLSDSTVLRVVSSMIGHHMLAQKSLLKGLNKVTLHQSRLQEDLEKSPELLSEPIQTVMRAHGVTDSYERLKEMTRGQSISLEKLHSLISLSHEIPESIKVELKNLTPEKYLGIAPGIVEKYGQNIINKYK